jgi:flagellar basal-body rod modification protein FlgD
MMVTQLQNQDPMNPASNSELLAQMSQIGQLQSSTDLQSTLKSMLSQTQLTTGGALIGKSVKGTLSDGKTAANGVVQSVNVASDGSVNLTLDSGSQMPLANVSEIEAPANTSVTGTATAPATSAAANVKSIAAAIASM